MRQQALGLLKVTLSVALAATAIFAQGSGGEKGTSVKNVVRLNRAPVNKEILRVTLPRPKETKLSNGLTVLVLEQHKLPTVAFGLWIKTGALADPKDLPGLAKFTAEMLHEGTTHRSSAQLAADVDEIGASLNASAGFGASTSAVSASGLAENTDRILELISDIVLNPTFPADEFTKYKERQLAILEQDRSEPRFLSQEKFFEILYRNFPAAEVSPTPESVKAATSEKLKEFHTRYYVPNNAILGVIGDVEFDSVLALIKKHFSDWKSHPVSPLELPPLPPSSPKKVVLVDRPDSVQTNILAGDYAVRRSDPDFIPLRVMNRVLGEGPSSRLFLNLREEKSYTYGAYSFFSADIYPGPWMATTEVRNAVTDGALHEFMYEFKRIRDEKVPDSELDDSRRSIVARFALSLEQPAQLLNFWMTANYYKLPEDYWDRYPEQVAAVSPDVVQRMARKYVDLDHLQIVCVGNGKEIKDSLKKYGPLEVFDTNGKREE